MKTIFKIVLGAAIACTVSTSIFSASFSKSRTYPDCFEDVKKEAWYYESVASAYEYGLINGKSETSFAPASQITVAEAVTLVSRIHSAYTGDGYDFSSVKADIWYQPYIDYAKKEGFVKDDTFDSYTRSIRRFELACLIHDALDEKAFEKINDVKVIPDVNPAMPYSEKLLVLYNAGIVMGNDSYGTFLPDSSIVRSEVAAIAVRAVDKSMRKKDTLDNQQVNKNDVSYYLIDEDRMTSDKNGVASGFVVDNKNEIYNHKGDAGFSNLLSDTETEYYSALRRDFEVQKDGVLTLETVFDITSGADGFDLHFEDTLGKTVLVINTKDGKLNVNEKANVDFSDEQKRVAMKAVIDIDKKSAIVFVNGEKVTDTELSDIKDVASLYIGTTKEGMCSVTVHTVKLYKNYVLNETVLVSSEKDELYGWNNDGFEIVKINSNPGYDNYSIVSNAEKGGKSTATRKFAPLNGKLVISSAVLFDGTANIGKFTLKSGAKDVLTVYTSGNKFMLDGKALRQFTANVWQNIRVEADMNSAKAVVKINGKVCAQTAFNASYIDSVEFTFDNKNGGKMWFDDVSVFTQEEIVPLAVEVAESEDFNVGIHVCNLWHGGASGEGWASVSAFDELKPYLGYYDEGNVTVADYELKWMAEHGIDFQHICWYAPSNDVTSAIKKPVNSDALHNGYFNSDLSKYVDFCIMWENNNFNLKNVDHFKNFVWNYWKDYYFTDSRYLVLDNKPVLTIWNYTKLKSDLGSDAKIKELFDFMRSDIKTLGFDGMIILFSDARETSKEFFENIAKTDADGTYSYSYYRYGSDPDYQITRMKEYALDGSVYHVPVASVGFNDVGRNEHRSDMITAQGFEEVLTYIRDTYLPNVKTGTWKDNTLFLSSWNEFSEGTYISPATSNGFSYLDYIRNVFTKADAVHTDTVPDENQVKNMGRLFPENYSPIRRLFLEEEQENTATEQYTAFKVWDFKEQSAKKAWDRGHGLNELQRNETTISGVSSEKDFAVFGRGLEEPIDSTRSILHLRMKLTNPETFPTNLELFYVTKEDATYEGTDKHIVVPCTSQGEYVDYYIDMSQTNGWKGTLKEIRLDPAQTPCEFEISLVELMSKDASAKKADIYINNHLMSFDFSPIYDEKLDDFLVAANPRLGFFSMLRTYYRYYPDDKKLIVQSNYKELEFVVGSDKVKVDGKELNLGYTFEMRDGLPVFAINNLVKLLGYSSQNDPDGSIRITSAPKKVLDVIEGVQGASWKFDIEGNNEGWTTQLCDGNVAGGVYSCKTTGPDAALNSSPITVDADSCKKIRIRMKLEKDSAGGFIQVFFAKNGGISEAQSVKYKYGDNFASTDGEFVEFVIDMSQNELWNGTVTKLRIDPFNGNGSFSIDYIMFE